MSAQPWHAYHMKYVCVSAQDFGRIIAYRLTLCFRDHCTADVIVLIASLVLPILELLRSRCPKAFGTARCCKARAVCCGTVAAHGVGLQR